MAKRKIIDYLYKNLNESAIQNNSISYRPEEIIGGLEKDFHPNYHLILHQKWKVVMGEKSSNYQVNPEIVAQYCKDLMPIVDILDGEMSESKGKIGSKWATIEMNLRKEKMSQFK